MNVRRQLGQLTLALTLAAALAAGAPPCARADVHEVLVVDFQFIPNDITIRTGDTVMFFWMEGSHTVTSFDGFFDSGLQFAPNVYLVDFPIGGEFRYFCRPHAFLNMVGVVRVEKGGIPQTISGKPRPRP